MSRTAITLCLLVLLSDFLYARQPSVTDSIAIRIEPRYDSVSNKHRRYFGENYRAEWAAETVLPIIRLSEAELTPSKEGGGHQSKSLRLKDKRGREWVLRSVRKYPDALTPSFLKGTFARDLLDDNFSAQHPFSALVVPVLASALKVPHTHPLIGYVAADTALGRYSQQFAGTVCLLEEREPEGDSESTSDMLRALDGDNSLSIDSLTFLRARILDLLLGDWDRHEDQWRWALKSDGSRKYYLPVPRDRDQVFFVNQGILPRKVAKTELLSFLKGFGPEITDVNHFFFNGRKLDQRFLIGISYARWMVLTREAVASLSDAVLIKALQALPQSSYRLRSAELLRSLRSRRDGLPQAMETYYKFLNRIADIKLTDQNEFVKIAGSVEGFSVQVNPKEAAGVALFHKIFDPSLTREVRIFLSGEMTVSL